MSSPATSGAILRRLDGATRALVRVSAALAGEAKSRFAKSSGILWQSTPHDWIEELLLQTCLFAGFPRALNGMREWRRLDAWMIEKSHGKVLSRVRS